jgi:hypothetical protein
MYWGGSFWGGSYWAGSYWSNLVLVPFDYAEIWDGVVYVSTAIAGSVLMNLEVNANVVMNRTIQQTNYSELEAI